VTDEDLIRSAGRRILGADIEVRLTPYGTRVSHGREEWIARRVESFPQVPAVMFELSGFPEMTDRTGPDAVWALVGDGDGRGDAFDLRAERSFAAFAAEVVPSSSPPQFAALVTHFWGRGMERVLVAPLTFSASGSRAAGVPAFPFTPPTLTFTDDGWLLEFLAAASTGRSDGTHVVYDIRRWTVRRSADGVDWQVRPLLLGVAGALAG
jgi:hypothetical protein